MKILNKLAVASVAVAFSATTAFSACSVDKGSVRILSNDFPALHAVVDFAEACISGNASFSKNFSTNHNEIQVSALTANPAEYTAKVVANGSIVPLLNDGLIRPLDDLVAKHGKNLQSNQLIRIDGKIMAVAFMANAQHLVVRQDILDKVGAATPTTYEEVLKTAEAIT